MEINLKVAPEKRPWSPSSMFLWMSSWCFGPLVYSNALEMVWNCLDMLGSLMLPCSTLVLQMQWYIQLLLMSLCRHICSNFYLKNHNTSFASAKFMIKLKVTSSTLVPVHCVQDWRRPKRLSSSETKKDGDVWMLHNWWQRYLKEGKQPSLTSSNEWVKVKVEWVTEHYMSAMTSYDSDKSSNRCI